MDSKLKAAFRWHRQNNIRNGAAYALAAARIDVANGRERYPAPLKPFPAFGAPNDSGHRWTENPEAAGLRLVGRVEADCGGRNGIWDKRESSGWYADECQYNLCFGLVYQLPGRKGESRFVAGYAFSRACGVALDLNRVYVEPRGFGYASAFEIDAARDAAFSADSMARIAAESEREYQTAWRAGVKYADEISEIDAVRAEIRDILQERRQLRGTAGYPALCGAITARVRDLLADLQERRNRRDELVQGEWKHLIFWPGDKRLAAAFNDGAGETVLPA